jgi:hypothetical protein
MLSSSWCALTKKNGKEVFQKSRILQIARRPRRAQKDENVVIIAQFTNTCTSLLKLIVC